MKDQLLSTRARHVLSIDTETAYTALVPMRGGSVEARDALELLKPAYVFATAAGNLEVASAALSGLWLWHDFLHESHELSQKIETPTGSYWHALMHRREGDFSNAKYWLRRCGSHAANASIAARADTLIAQLPADKALIKLTARGTWNGEAFVDLVEAVQSAEDDPRRPTVVALQRLEWRTLFETTLDEK